MLQKLDTNGDAVWQSGGIKMFEMVSTNCLLIPDSTGGAFVVVDALAQYEPEFHSRGTFFQRIDKNGNTGIMTAISDEDANHKSLLCASATSFPNPFTTATTFRLTTGFTTPGEHSHIVVYDVLGREVKRYDIQNFSGEILSIRWNGRDNHGAEIAPGVYFYSVSTKNNVILRGKLLRLRGCGVDITVKREFAIAPFLIISTSVALAGLV